MLLRIRNENEEEIQLGSLCNGAHITNTMLKDEEPLSNSEGNMVGSRHDQETTNNGMSATNTGAYRVLCCKVSMAFGVCFIIGCFLLPLIFYYVNQTGGDSKLDSDYSNGQNISSIKVCYNYKNIVLAQINIRSYISK